MMLLLTISLAALTITPAFTWPAEDIIQELAQVNGVDPPKSTPVSTEHQAQQLLYGAMQEENGVDEPHNPLPITFEQEVPASNYGSMQELAEAQFYLRYEIPVNGLAIGQSVEVVYKNPNSGVVAVYFVTDTGAVSLHVNPRYNWGGNVNFLYLNTFFSGRWQHYQTAPGFPFPANGVSTTVSLRITVQQNSFLILANDIPITRFAFRHSLSPKSIRKIQWTVLDNTATRKAVLETLALHF